MDDLATSRIHYEYEYDYEYEYEILHYDVDVNTTKMKATTKVAREGIEAIEVKEIEGHEKS